MSKPVRRFEWSIVLSLVVLGAAKGDYRQGSAGDATTRMQYSALRPSAQFEVGANADWVAIGADAVWVAGMKPDAVHRIDPKTNSVVATVALPGSACSGLALGFRSLWVPTCGAKNSLVRVDTTTNRITATLPIGPARSEGGIAVSDDSVWIVSDDQGTLARIDPVSNTVRQKVSIPAGSYNPVYSHGRVWITGFSAGVVTVVDANTGEVATSIRVGPRPRFATAGGGSVWILNQGDGTVTRVDERTLAVVATIPAGIPGEGGDIDYGGDSVWATVFGTPLTQIDVRSNRILRQWKGTGGDSLRIGFNSIWITDYRKGLLLRIPLAEAARGNNQRRGGMHFRGLVPRLNPLSLWQPLPFAASSAAP